MKRNFSMAWWHLGCAWREIKDAARELIGVPRKPIQLAAQSDWLKSNGTWQGTASQADPKM